MQISQRGIDLIKEFEGFKADAYPDPGTGGDPWTIGYGTTTNVQPGDTITQDEAEARLRLDVMTFGKAVNRLVTVPLAQSQFDALVSFVYNVGPGAFQSSTLLRKLNQGRYDDVPSELARWNKAGGRVMNGLVRRRSAEAELWNNHDTPMGMPQRVEPSDPPPRQGKAIAATVATATPAVSAAGGFFGYAQSDIVQIVLILVAVAVAVGAFVAWKRGWFE